MGEKISRRKFVKAGTTVGIAAAVMPGGTATAFAAGKTARWGMLIDLRRCYGCKACAVACKAEFDTRLGVFNSNVIAYEKGKFPEAKRDFVPWLCNHCAEPPCVKVCPAPPVEKTLGDVTYEAAATYERPDGAVLYDVERCIGCHACVRACPYKARYIDPLLKAGAAPGNHAIGKCTFCIHRVENDVEPSCVNTCPGNARIFGDLNDAGSEISKIIAANQAETKMIHPDYGTSPYVFYIDYDEEAYDKGFDIRNETPDEWGQTRR
ncbi:MAG: 4Fe-4S dicluster domain-containing protein [bacterium]